MNTRVLAKSCSKLTRRLGRIGLKKSRMVRLKYTKSILKKMAEVIAELFILLQLRN